MSTSLETAAANGGASPARSIASAVVEHVPAAIALLGRDGRAIWANPAMSELLGRPVGELLGASAFTLVHPQDLLRARAGLRSTAHSPGMTGPAEYRVRFPSGQWRTVRVTGTNLLGEPAVGGIIVHVEPVDAVDVVGRPGSVVDRLNEVVFQTDAMGNWTYLNRAWTTITGFTAAESMGRSFLEFLHPDEVEATLDMFKAVVSGAADHCHHEGRYRTADGRYVWMELRATVMRDAHGALVGNSGTIIDITARRRAQDLLREQTATLELIARAGPLPDTLQVLADLLTAHTGVRVRVVLDGEHPPGRVVDRRRVRGAPSVVVPIRSATTGSELGRFVAREVVVLDDGQREVAARCSQLAAIAIERRDAQEEMRRQALHDPSTGLPNRLLLADRIDHAIGTARRYGHLVGVLLLDLDRFKDVNDTMGHEAGDDLLAEVGLRLDMPLREVDTVSRIGADEFVVVLSELESAADARRVTQRLESVLEEPLMVHGVALRASASIGIALFPDHGGDLPTLLRRADAAMQRAKHRGGGHAFYDVRNDAERIQHVGMVSELRDAIEHDQLLLHYQPKIDLRSGRAVGVEALVRWRHPQRGLVPPDEFIPLAERTGLIERLSRWVLKTALLERQTWTDLGHDVTLAINLSAHNLHDEHLGQLVEDAVAQSGIAPGDLELEITESAVMVDPEGALEAICRLVDAGIGFAIDDFGTGYSSLAYLKQLPARSIKIDKSLVHDIASEERSAAIVRSTIQLAHDLGIDVVGEGVETERTAELLGELACDFAQGYRFARPMPAAELPRWLATQTAAASVN